MKKAISIMQIASGAAINASRNLGIIEACTHTARRERRGRSIRL